MRPIQFEIMKDTMATVEQRKDSNNNRGDVNKLRDGPCAEHYSHLEKCAASSEKNITSHMVSCC